ncbi:hydantoinase B/oxoprolinase family protein [Paraburkholderia phytofirmans]|uniref:5-oxoprolinase (ATP-hydrolyzing) n=1 Tax=Paraburkholderia phytofirmans (strain DSM 17436 / LMG 22146 / PsJN) TaxID=398527 RepID=B2TB96_PARPJ|nr:hydantoinase B/oxoprolinase family protein [Paraburkholderia phytofirmans]ACD20838.1 5-oxoprolinase (ATP-hydrolyzing) [Paraburkholderia phytofirmans PsJN]
MAQKSMSGMSTKRGDEFDSIAMEVFSNRLLTITEDMAINMMRSSFSSQIKERRDFSVGLFDALGRLIAQGTHIPLHLGSLVGSVEAVLARYSLDEMKEGDAFICNDPYLAGGTHLPDISIVTPIFENGRPFMFAANIGHHQDIGGPTPGSTSANAKSLFEEGLRIPVIRIARGGAIDEDLLSLIAANSRLPEERTLDLKVQIATNLRGGAAVHSLVQRMGTDAVQQSIDAVLAYTKDRLRQRVLAMPDGEYSFTTYLDDDGFGGEPLPIKATVTIDGEKISIDMTGTCAQARGGLNVPRNALNATVYYCVKALIDPELMANSGLMDGVTVSAPPGTIVSPNFPAAVSARSITCQKIAGAIFGAMRPALPAERVIASGNDILPSLSFSGTSSNGSAYVFGETLGGGSGARSDFDGMDGVHVHITNTLNMPTEALEHEFPLVVEGYGYVEDSAGSGKCRGGMGIVRQVRALKENTVVSVRSDSHKIGAAGVNGGGEGGKGRVTRNFGTDRAETLASKVAGIVLKAGETIRIETPGGGGYGHPEERPIEALAADLRDGILSREFAEQQYGAERVTEAISYSKSAK